MPPRWAQAGGRLLAGRASVEDTGCLLEPPAFLSSCCCCCSCCCGCGVDDGYAKKPVGRPLRAQRLARGGAIRVFASQPLRTSAEKATMRYGAVTPSMRLCGPLRRHLGSPIGVMKVGDDVGCVMRSFYGHLLLGWKQLSPG